MKEKLAATQKLLLVLIGLNTAVVLGNFIPAPHETMGKNPIVFMIAKIFIVPLPYIFYLFSIQKFNIHCLFVSIFSILAWIGDIVLFGSSRNCFVAAGFLFGFAHISMITNLFTYVKWSKLPLGAYPFMVFPFLIFGYTFRNFFTNQNIHLILYCLALLIGFDFAIARCSTINIRSPGYWIVSFGYASIVYSDYYLLKNNVQIDPIPQRIRIILSYCISQCCILCGLSL